MAAALRPLARRRLTLLRRWAGLLLVVLVLHGLLVQWLASELPGARLIRPLPPPLLTRQVMPHAVAPAPLATPNVVKKKPVAVVKSKSSAIQNVAIAEPTPAATTLPEPEQIPPQVTEPPAQTTTVAPAPAPTQVAANTDTSPRWQDRYPLDARLSYTLSGNFRGTLTGSASVLWQLVGEQYQASVEARVWPLTVRMTSQGRITPEGIYPQLFEEDLRGLRRSVRLQDDVVILDKGQRLPRSPGVQDTASQFVELAHRFATGRERLEVGQVIRCSMARPGGVDDWVYDVVAEDTLNTPQWGPLQAFHLKPRPLATPRGTIVMEAWYAPSLDYLPVRIRINVNADTFVDLLVQSAQQAAPRAPASSVQQR